MRITKEAIKKRVEKIRKVMSDQKLEALVIYSGPTSVLYGTATSANVKYLTNWADRSSPSLFILPLNADPVLFVTTPFAVGALKEKHDLWFDDVRSESNMSLWGNSAIGILEDRDIPKGTVGLVGLSEMPTPIYLGLTSLNDHRWKFEQTDKMMALARVVKEPEEIEIHRQAAKIADSVLYTMLNGARQPEKWAWQLLVDGEYTGRQMGAEPSTGWISTGPTADYPSFERWDSLRKIEPGDRINGGTYIVYEGYWGHSIRMGIKGKPSSTLQDYFKVILQTQEEGIKNLIPGKPLANVYRAMRKIIDEHCPVDHKEDKFRFRPGHGLGLEYSEPIVTDAFPQPYLWSVNKGVEDDQVLVQKGMVLELHPNFGVPGVGMICFGDMLLVGDSGPEILTKFPRELYEI